jgi:methylenetetrahydrofolate dehydrogenase (NADP+)/methenyltetrahydrofolate cyclohydrolase
MKLLNGSELALFIKERQAKQVRNLRQEHKVVPRLAIVQTVDNPVIDTYVRLKQRYANDILVECELHKVAQEDALATIDALNARDDVHGIIVQLPLADTSQTDEIVRKVAPSKDVDGLGAAPKFDPATPIAINWLLAGYGVDLAGRTIAIIGNGRLVGAPLARMWQASHYSVTVFDSTSTDMASRLRDFNVIVSATGVPRLITPDMVQVGAVLVDAGTASEEGVVVGDISPEVRTRDDITITPEKGGVGPLTTAALLDNVILAARRTVAENESS